MKYILKLRPKDFRILLSLLVLVTIILFWFGVRSNPLISSRKYVLEGTLNCKENNVIAHDGTTLFYNTPHAIYFSGEQDRTYFGWTTSQGQVNVRHYDHSNNNLSEITTILDYKEKADDHAAPAIIILNNKYKKGKILVAHSFHNSKLHLFESVEVESTENLVQVKEWDIVATYPRLLQSNNNVFIFFRSSGGISQGNLSVIYSTNGGQEWSKPVVLLDFEAEFVTYANSPIIIDDEIIINFVNYNTIDQKHGPEIYLQSISIDELINTSSFTTITSLDTPVFYDSDMKNARVFDLVAKNKKQINIGLVTYMEEFSRFLPSNNKAYNLTLIKKDGEWAYSEKNLFSYVDSSYYAGSITINPKQTQQAIVSSANETRKNITLKFLGANNENINLLLPGNSDLIRPSFISNYHEEMPLTFLKVKRYARYTDFQTELMYCILN